MMVALLVDISSQTDMIQVRRVRSGGGPDKTTANDLAARRDGWRRRALHYTMWREIDEDRMKRRLFRVVFIEI
jgi:hypothetical protein